MSNFNEALHWRYATKKFDTAKKLTQAQLDDVLEAARLSASSYGLQPYKLLVITDPALRAQLRAAAWDQAQVTDASHLIIFAAHTTVDDAYVDAFVANIAKTRGLPAESLAPYREMMVGSMHRMTPDQQKTWSQKQAYIGVGTLLAACAHATIDACPMEGFDPAKVDEILGLPALGLTSTVFCPVGFRAADDATAAYAKVRKPKEEFIIKRA